MCVVELEPKPLGPCVIKWGRHERIGSYTGAARSLGKHERCQTDIYQHPTSPRRCALPAYHKGVHLTRQELAGRT